MGERVAVWFRVSTSAQSERNQYPAVLGHCGERGYEIVRRFELHGDSAYKGMQEPELLEVLADVRSGLYSKLVIFDSSRLDRRDRDTAEFYRLSVVTAGGVVESVTEPLFGAKGVAGDVMTTVVQHQNHDHSEKLSKATRAGHARIDEVGALRTKALFGYRISGPKYGKKMMPTAEGKRLVPQVFSMIAAGDSCETVARWLAEQAGRRVYAKTIASMIRRPGYRGSHEWTHVTAEGRQVTLTHRCPALVDGGTWQRANERLDEPPHRGRTTNAPALLKGLVRCGNCGSAMNRKNCRYFRSSGERVDCWYYRCGGDSHRKGCGTMARLDAADRTVHLLLAKLGYTKVVTRRKVTGPDWKAEARLAERQLRELPRMGLDWAEEDARRAALRERYSECLANAAGPQPDQWEETSATIASRWEALESDAARNAFLLSQRFRFRLWKDQAEVTQGEPGDRSWRQVTAPLPVIPRARGWLANRVS